MVDIDLFTEEKDTRKIYFCKGCGTIIKTHEKPTICTMCGFEKFTLLKIEDEDVRLRVLSLLHQKDFGQASELLVKTLERNNHIYTTKVDKAQEIFIYKDGIYIPEGESEIKSQLRIIMQENYSEWLSNQVLSKIRTDTFIDPEVFFMDRNNFMIPVQNGILDLKKVELKPFTPEEIYFSKLPITFDIKCYSEKIDKFLEDVLANPDDVKVFYELAGFGLIKEYIFERAFMMVGNGRNGKSKSLELLKRLVGTNNCSAVPLSSLTPTSPFVQSLWKKHFNLAGDLSSSDLKETGMFKQLTGRDPIAANRKYKNTIEFCNYAKMVFACNDLPRVYDYSDGFWDRWILLEFPYKFVSEEVYNNATDTDKKNLKIRNPTIIEEITTEEEMSGFLNNAIIGLHRIFNNKKFSYSTGTVEVKNKWIRKADSFMAFCMDYIEEDYESYITNKEIRSTYKQFCRKHKVSGTSDKSIAATLQEMFGATSDRKWTDSSTQERIWSGIKLKTAICDSSAKNL